MRRIGAAIGIIGTIFSLIVPILFLINIAVVTFIQINQALTVRGFLFTCYFLALLLLLTLGFVHFKQLMHSKTTKRLSDALSIALILYLSILFGLYLSKGLQQSLFILTLGASILSLFAILIGFLIIFLSENTSFLYSKTSACFHDIIIYYFLVNVSFIAYLSTKLGFFFGLCVLIVFIVRLFKTRIDLVDLAFKYWLAISIIFSVSIWAWIMLEPTSRSQFNLSYFLFVVFILIVAVINLRRIFFRVDLLQVGLVYIWLNIGPLILYPLILSSQSVSPGPIMIVYYPLFAILFALFLINVQMFRINSADKEVKGNC